MQTNTAHQPILVVDDDPGLREALQDVLELEGYDVVLARDGQEALRLLEDAHPVLVLLDLMMPRMNGYEFVAELERRSLRDHLPVVILTADANAKRKAEQVGAEGYLAKPFEIDQVLATVDRILQQGRSGDR